MENNFIFFDNLKNDRFKILYLLGSDNLVLKKNNEFIIYQGSHGDKGAEIADVILPNPAYTEQNGLYSNLEGRIQECRKASYPPGEALEDWKIFNLISKKLDQAVLFKNIESLRDEVCSLIPNFSEIGLLPKITASNNKKKESIFENQKIIINKIDYYYTNAISRSSKTMSECRRVQNEQLKDGTNF
jgi:NADH-quinone oxidoreductase subunit G